MCGRFTHLFKWRQLHRLMLLTSPPWEFPRRYNVAPTQNAPVVRADPSNGGASGSESGGRRVDMLRWGLIPWWADDPSIGGRLINARAETVHEKPAFRSAFKSRRCLVPVSGFYEWQAQPGMKRKQPYYFRPAGDDELFVFVGLWERWSPKESAIGGGGAPKPTEPIESFTIITTTANELMAGMHDRMPVILDERDFNTWLDARATPDVLRALLKPFPAELMLAEPVSDLVNSPKNDGPECLSPPRPRPRPSPPSGESGLFPADSA